MAIWLSILSASNFALILSVYLSWHHGDHIDMFDLDNMINLIIVMWINFYMIYLAASINSYFDIYKESYNLILEYIHEMYDYAEDYFGSKIKLPPNPFI